MCSILDKNFAAVFIDDLYQNKKYGNRFRKKGHPVLQY